VLQDNEELNEFTGSEDNNMEVVTNEGEPQDEGLLEIAREQLNCL